MQLFFCLDTTDQHSSYDGSKRRYRMVFILSFEADYRNEALRNQGILPPKQPDQTEQFEEVLQQAIQEAEQNRLENLNLDELAELEDDEDDEFLETYRYNSYKQVAGQWANVLRQKRMQEMREFQSKSQFGTVEPLTKPDFVKEVTEASASTWVFVHLFKD